MKSPEELSTFVWSKKIETCENFFDMKRKFTMDQNSDYKREENI